MDKDKTYAVVDLETTGTKVDKGDRIIQFGCALIKKGKIVKTITQDINPNREIPEPIVQLTGITNEQVAQAPYFEEVANSLHEILDHTVFVAHNINFDLPFLNTEFKRIGLPPLDVMGIDTVELSQILLTETNSFRLKDLTSFLNIQHDHPHQADSDALVTAKLFIILDKKLQHLPLPTLHMIAEKATHLSRQTQQYLQAMDAYRQQQHQALPDQFYQKAGIVLRHKYAFSSAAPQLQQYPVGESAKKQLFKQADLRLRKTQVHLMDDIYANATSQKPLPMLLEAGTGLGKSLGYLLPLSFLATPARKLVIATSTRLLQKQLLFKTIPTINKVRNGQLTVAIVKSQQHYLNLNRFYHLLQEDHSLPNQLAMLRILVWLTKTTTGDLDELHFNLIQNSLITKINCIPGEAPAGPFDKSDEFYPYVHRQQGNADILLTNHAYLIHHYQEDIFGEQSYLVVDEAQHFPDEVEEILSNKLHLGHLMNAVQQIYDDLRPNSNTSTLLFDDDLRLNYQVMSLIQALFQAIKLITDFQDNLYQRFIAQQIPREKRKDPVLRQLSSDELHDFVNDEAPLQQQIFHLLTDIKNVLQRLINHFMANVQHFTLHQQKIVQNLNQALQTLDAQLQQYQDWLTFTTQSALQDYLVSVDLPHYGDNQKITLTWQLFNSSQNTQQLLKYFRAPIFIGATLRVNRKFDYLRERLGFGKHTPLIEQIYRSPFSYKKQAELLVTTDGPNPQDMDEEHYAEVLTQQLLTLLPKIDHQTMVLFNSKAMIAAVYRRLKATAWGNNAEILAQGVHGSNEKLLKRFMTDRPSVLLGAASFWEGVDLPAQALEVLIITRLPFASPDDRLVQARAAQLEKMGKDPFKEDALPRATLRLQQGLGRLLRTQTDRGILLVLDPRLANTQYGQHMQHGLPTSLPKSNITTAEVISRIQQFFANRNEEN